MYHLNNAKIRKSLGIKQKISEITTFFYKILHFSHDFICFIKGNSYICNIILYITHKINQ
ncbi:hypothetical protein CEP85_06930 [Prevotella melaninogenica]|nr:hypothetical protein CEP85_06930 [Prevotella melaninogenica]